MWRLIALSVVSLLLGACAPNAAQMGITPGDWHRATEAQKAAWRDAYLFYKKVHPDLAGDLHGVQLKVHVSGGGVLFPPLFQQPKAYLPFSLTLYDGQCRHVVVLSKVDPAKSNSLYACFAKHTLALDPSRIDKQSKDGSLIINNNPLWQHEGGWVYRSVSSTGYLSLSKVNIRLELKKSA